jgi:GDP/UDP-N,N'-diacetylbacillosamine 2-epimerase (hydrolysing)
MLRIGVLTSSRADFGIYSPLLEKLKEDSFFTLEIIAFGTHLSKMHGFTLSEIEKDGYLTIHRITNILSNDDDASIATSYGLTVLKFAEFWSIHTFDIVFCLGDRFEMSAAVQAGIPYRIKFAHFHGGETTLGSIDNIFRHQITLASSYHFTANEIFSKKIAELKGDSENIYTIGSLSLDGINKFVPTDKLEFYNKYQITQEDYALITFHPETIALERNKMFSIEMKKALKAISSKLFLVVSMPNADTMGTLYREQLDQLKQEIPSKIVCIESFGKENYFNAIYFSRLMIGNTSSGIIEAASFGKYVVNVGDRQKGRAQSCNVFNCNFDEKEIINIVEKAQHLGHYNKDNIYYRKDAIECVIKILKTKFI